MAIKISGSTVISDSQEITSTSTVSASGNITGGNVVTGGIVSATGNIRGGNFNTTGLISATGNITGGNISATAITGTLATAAQTNITSVGTLTSLDAGAISSSGNITGANISTTGSITATTVIGNVQSTGPVSTTGNVTAGNITTAGVITVNSGGAAIAIINGSTDGVGNIGSTGDAFNTVFAKATSAQYADLAENYAADAEYAPGTVVVFGGTAEVTVNAVDGDRRVAGIVSTNPAYIMNDRLATEYVATVGLTGRVPCFVVGPVRKGDLMVSAGLGRARAEADPKVGTVIGKALEDFDGAEGTIEVVVGRF